MSKKKIGKILIYIIIMEVILFTMMSIIVEMTDDNIFKILLKDTAMSIIVTIIAYISINMLLNKKQKQ